MLGRPLYFWLLIPLVSALIGYFTNWVAIRMLFRPHREKRVFGLRVPFTPGLIPRKRAELARSIGRAVSERLITREAILTRLADEDIKRQIREFVHRRLQEVLDRELPAPEAFIPEALRPALEGALTRLEVAIARELPRALEGPTAEELLQRAWEELAKRSLGGVFPEETPRFLARFLAEVAAQPEVAERFGALLEERISSFLKADRPLRDYLSPEAKEAFYTKLGEWLPAVLEHLVGVLADPGVQKRIKIYLYELVERLLSQSFPTDSFWGQLRLTLFGTLVISPEELKERIDQAVEELPPRAAELVRQPEVQRRVYRRLIDLLERLLARSPAELRLNGLLGELRLKSWLQRLLEDRAATERLEKFFEALWTELRSRSLHELLPGAVAEGLPGSLIQKLRELLAAPEAQEALRRVLHERLMELRRRPLGRLRSRVPEELVQRLEDWASVELLRLLQRETPQLIAAIDIERLVADKVGEFSVAEVEELIVGVTGEQLRAITWFGAVLGFLIGLVQLGILLVH